MQSIKREIEKLMWENDKDIDSATSRVIAILEALNEIAEQLANINKSMNR